MTKELLDTVLKEGKITILSDELKIRLSEYAERLFNINIKNIYKNSPNFFNELKTNDVLSNYYKKFIILCCLLDYPNIDSSEEFFINWRKLHHDDNIKAFLQGPLVNSKMKFDFIKYYNSIVNPYIESIEGYHQISLLQNQSKILEKITSDIKSLEKSLERFPKNANAYQLYIDTSKINRKMIIEDNFVIDCSSIDIGIPSIENFQSSIKKIEYLFNNFTRLKIKMRVYKNLYKQSLDSFKHCFLVFDGIDVFERTIYNIEGNYLRVGGKFILNNDWFEFVPDFKRVVFRNSNQSEFKMNDINRFRIYIISDNSKLFLKSNRVVQIQKVFNEKSLEQIKSGFINVSNRFVYCTYNNSLQEIDVNNINNSKDFDNIYYWKEYSNDTYKTLPIRFSKIFNINKLNENFIKANIDFLRIVINEFSEEPLYTFENNVLTIENEEYSVPCFYKGFKFYLENETLKIEKPNEYKENNVKYRILRFSNATFEENLESNIKNSLIDNGLKISITDSFKQPSQFNDYIDAHRDGRMSVVMNDNDSVIFSNNSIFMRTEIENLYNVYGNKNIQKEIIKDGKEIELMMSFS